MAKKIGERTFVTSITFPISYDIAAQNVIEKEGGSFGELVRTALQEYLIKKGELQK